MVLVLLMLKHTCLGQEWGKGAGVIQQRMMKALLNLDFQNHNVLR